MHRSPQDLNDFVTEREGVLTDLCKASDRVSPQSLTEGVQIALPDASEKDRANFTGLLLRSFQHCHYKARSFTTGKKLEPAVYRIATFIRSKRGSSPLSKQKTFDSPVEVPQKVTKTSRVPCVIS